MPDRTDPVDRMAEALRAPVTIDPDLNRRVMGAIADLPTPVAAERWWRRRWTVRVSPLGGLAAAAAVAGIVAGGWWIGQRTVPTAPPPATAGQVVQFVLVAPSAESVHLVGDFNDWNLETTALVREAGDGIWSVAVPLMPGRYRYAFVVDGSVWQRDPTAASARDDEFGRPSSVMTLGEV